MPTRRPGTPTDVGDAGHLASNITLRSGPADSWYKPFTGTAPGALASTGLGLVGGRYLAAPLLRWMFPDTFKNKKGTELVSTIGGGLLGLASMAPQIAQSSQYGGWWSGGPGTKYRRGQSHSFANQQANGKLYKASAFDIGKQMAKEASWWTESAAERGLYNEIARGTLSPIEAVQIMKKNREAEVGSTGLMNSGLFGKAMGGGAAGYLAARTMDSIVNPGMPSDQQQNRGYLGALIGAGLNTMLG
jgi:hypothetical protein